jgi:hypothetical protein
MQDASVLVGLSENGTFRWQRLFPRTATCNTINGVSTLAIDSQGSLVVATDLFGDCDFGGGIRSSGGTAATAFVLVKYDADGNYLWDHLFSQAPLANTGGVAKGGLVIGANDDIVVALNFAGSVDFGGGSISDSGTGDAIAIARFTSMGNLVWSQRAPVDDSRQFLSVDGAGNVAHVGTYYNPVILQGVYGSGVLDPLGDPHRNVFVAKFTP